jgi:5-methylthioribose kinase
MEMSDFSASELIQIAENSLEIRFVSPGVEVLSGGNLNKVWRVSDTQKSVIIKHAPPFIASQPDVPLDSGRIHFEAKALKLFRGDGKLSHLSSNKVKPPEIYHFDQPNSLIVMEDVGNFESLGTEKISTNEAEIVGNRLGEFIGKLHAETFKKKQFGRSFNNTEIQKTRGKVQYKGAANYADVSFIDEITKNEVRNQTQQLGKDLLKPGKCLVMGDLWPSSVLVNEQNMLRIIGNFPISGDRCRMLHTSRRIV